MTTRRAQQYPNDLIECRRKLGITLSEIAARSKINVRYLEAIERGEYEKLPGGVYSVSYLRQYAEAVGGDGDSLVQEYLEATGPVDPPSSAAPTNESWAVRIWERFMSWLDEDIEDEGSQSRGQSRDAKRRMDRPPTPRAALSNRYS